MFAPCPYLPLHVPCHVAALPVLGAGLLSFRRLLPAHPGVCDHNMEAEDPVSHLRNNLNCPICWEVFSNPLSLQCGHSFCQSCIHTHWDREAAMPSAFTCPECRLSFPQRPEPQKNVSLSKVVDDMKALERSRAPVPAAQTDTSAHNAVPALCQRHHQGLIMYCSTDSRCICIKCLMKGCKHHDLQEIDELSAQQKMKLSNDLLASDCLQKHAEEEMEKWKLKIENMKVFYEKIVSGIITTFEQVRKSLDECQILVVNSVNCDKNVALTQAEDHVTHLQRHLDELQKHRAEAERLLRSDGVTFLEHLPQLVPVGVAPGSPNIQQCGNLQIEAVTKIMPEVTRLLQEELPNMLHPEKPKKKCQETSDISTSVDVNDACSIARTSGNVLCGPKESTPRRTPAKISTLRVQLCKDYRNLKFNPETANKYIEISHENCKATHKLHFRKNHVSDATKKFQSWQVMCTEGFTEGSHYWEVVVSTFFVEVGVAYGSLKLDSTIGRNSSSWSLQLRSMHHSFWHNNKETKLQSPMFAKIGVHIDLTAGSLTFYGIQNGSLQLLHSLSWPFSEKVFPVFWIGEDANVTICTMPNTAMDAVTVGR
ncbi:hypothetical protein GDO81_013148 [Engystomops pustulosus]|uniref:Tripartite motif-containing protein 65 n=1 Tax=Engystomops pustulosus TaxID=76066 RepID=A0AAV7B3N4_ENGPU|nr:hypothetical protein GDO81_013148 [Engystomops pustulosus]